jgi:hypothetical protein
VRALERMRGCVPYSCVDVWLWLRVRRPETDCQVSITWDLVLCTCVTLVAIYRRTGSLAVTLVAGLMAPFLSPAVGHLINSALFHVHSLFSVPTLDAARPTFLKSQSSPAQPSPAQSSSVQTSSS